MGVVVVVERFCCGEGEGENAGCCCPGDLGRYAVKPPLERGELSLNALQITIRPITMATAVTKTTNDSVTFSLMNW